MDGPYDDFFRKTHARLYKGCMPFDVKMICDGILFVIYLQGVWLLEGEEIVADGERVIITEEEDEDGMGIVTTLRITKVSILKSRSPREQASSLSYRACV